MDDPFLYRERLIPQECIPLKDDVILYHDNDIIVTSWKALHPKHDLDHGFSCYFLNKGIKVSKFLYSNGDLIYWYCDIIDYKYDAVKNTYVFRDLLADVLVLPDGFVKVVDLDEFEKALEDHLLTVEDVEKALCSLNNLLQTIYNGKFDVLKDEIEKRI